MEGEQLKPVRWVGSSRQDIRFTDALYVLHAFQKKSKKGIATPKKEIDLIRERLDGAERDYRKRQN